MFGWFIDGIKVIIYLWSCFKWMIIDIYNENNEFVDYDVSVGNCIWEM